MAVALQLAPCRRHRAWPNMKEQGMKTYRIATIPGDGIGKEVVPAGQAVLQALAAPQSRFNFDMAAEWI